MGQPARAQEKSFTGEIFAGQCAKAGSHDKMMKQEGVTVAKDCTLKCVDMGGRFVLYDKGRKATYQLSDQDKAKQYARQEVKVTGTYDRTKKTI